MATLNQIDGSSADQTNPDDGLWYVDVYHDTRLEYRIPGLDSAASATEVAINRLARGSAKCVVGQASGLTGADDFDIIQEDGSTQTQVGPPDGLYYVDVYQDTRLEFRIPGLASASDAGNVSRNRLSRGAAKTVVDISENPVPVPDVTFTGEGTSTLDLFSNATTGATSQLWEATWTVVGMPVATTSGQEYSLNAELGWSGDWLDTNPGHATTVDPTSCAFTIGQLQRVPAGAYEISFVASNAAGNSDPLIIYVGHVRTASDSITISTSRGAAILATPTGPVSNVPGDGVGTISVGPIAAPTNSTSVSVVLLTGGDTGPLNDYFAEWTLGNGQDHTFDGLNPGSYRVILYGFATGRNGPCRIVDVIVTVLPVAVATLGGIGTDTLTMSGSFSTGTDLSYQWTASTASIDDPTALNTTATYDVGFTGDDSVTLTVTDADLQVDSSAPQSVSVVAGIITGIT